MGVRVDCHERSLGDLRFSCLDRDQQLRPDIGGQECLSTNWMTLSVAPGTTTRSATI